MTVLHFEDVSYRYEGVSDWALRDLNLAVSAGEYVLVAGSSGCGKSTLCRASTGLIPHFHGGELKGRILVDGMDSRRHPVYRLLGHVGLAFQNTDAQLFNQTVETELIYGLESLGLEPTEIERRLTWVSDLVDLGYLMDRSPHRLSGGEKQRVVLGAILSMLPRLLILDEPFTHLDPEGAERLRAILRAVRAEGIAVVVVEHRLHEVIADVDRLVVMHRGTVVEDGTPRQVLTRDLPEYGLNLPALVRLFREWGWAGSAPLSIYDALALVRSSRGDLKNSLCGKVQGPSLYGATHPKDVGPQSGQPRPCVDVEGVWFSYNGSEVLRDINLKLGRGGCVALLGRNGSGKTTLVKHLNGLLKPKQGRVDVLGHDSRVTPTAELARHVGFAWQNPNDQLFQASVREEVLAGPRILGTYDSVWCGRLFERFALGPLLDRSPFRLSEGEKKRVAFATALANRPELVVLDEPTAGQDEPFRRELGRLISELRDESRTILLVTHDLEFASEHGDLWLALADGRMIAEGSPEAIMADSKTMASAGLRPTQRFQFLEALSRLFGDCGREGDPSRPPL